MQTVLFLLYVHDLVCTHQILFYHIILITIIILQEMSDYLTIADLKRLYLVTFDARIKWRKILLILDVPQATIHSIGKDWSNNPVDCYREGLIKWLNEGGKSWKEMVEALSSPIVSEVHIAQTIKRDHLQSTGPSNPTDMKSEGKYRNAYFTHDA